MLSTHNPENHYYNQHHHPHHHPHHHHNRPSSPPTKASLKAWWHQFTFVQRAKKEPAFVREYEKGSAADHPVFGRPLNEILKYASVPISTANQNGDLYVWGYVPVVVAKCGLYLKENATEVPGTFRVNGSNRRMRELQLSFETPPKYGKNINWKREPYTTHDVASVFRRYLTQMPEPVIPHDMYHKFRDAIAKEPYDPDEVIAAYKSLIRQMPVANQHLLLYVLDLLNVFARKSDKNLMTATNLAVIFRPGILSHPSHEMSPYEHTLSQRVVEFLIAHQDWFVLDIPMPASMLSQSPIPPSSSPRSGAVSPQIPQAQVAVAGQGRQGSGSGSVSGSAQTLVQQQQQQQQYRPQPQQQQQQQQVVSLSASAASSPLSPLAAVPPIMGSGTGHTQFVSGSGDRGGPGTGSKFSTRRYAGHEQGVSEDGGMVMSEKERERELDKIKWFRRRTTLERGEPGIYGALAEGDLSTGEHSPTTTMTFSGAQPLQEEQNLTSSSNRSTSPKGTAGVARSLTLPSSSRRGKGARVPDPGTEPPRSSTPNANVNMGVQGGEERKRDRARLLKKQKRASVATPQQHPHNASEPGSGTTRGTGGLGWRWS